MGGDFEAMYLRRSLALVLLALVACELVADPSAQPVTHGSAVNHPRPLTMHNRPGLKTASKRSGLDPSNFLVVVIAAVILMYGANRALRPPFMDMSASSQEAMAYEEAAEAGEMQLHTTFMFVITASCSLVLIFYFMSAMSVLISVLFSFISSLALGALVYPYVDRYTDHRSHAKWMCRIWGPCPFLSSCLRRSA